jgi:hypothetical protein
MLDETFTIEELEDKIYNLVKDFPEINTIESILKTIRLDPKFKYVQKYLIPKVIFARGKFEIIRTRIVAVGDKK